MRNTRIATAADATVGETVRVETPRGTPQFEGVVTATEPDVGRVVIKRDVGSGVVSKDLSFGRGVPGQRVGASAFGRVDGIGLSNCRVVEHPEGV